MRRTRSCRNEQLIREDYRGIRPAPGYPGLPRSQPQAACCSSCLAKQPAGVELTENFAMLPTSAVSGFYFAHPDASYFGVARIGQDQLEEYAERRGVDVEPATRWLRPNLD